LADHHPLLPRNRNQAKSEADFVLVADLARQLGRRDLAVIAGQAAENAGYDNFHDLAFR
jgi:soluble lytic murein transglycosylase